MVSHFLKITPCTMAIFLTPSVNSHLVELLEGGGFSLQVSALECLNRCMQICKFDAPLTKRLAQAVASVVSRWQLLGPTDSPLLPVWQAQLSICLQDLLHTPTGKPSAAAAPLRANKRSFHVNCTPSHCEGLSKSCCKGHP